MTCTICGAENSETALICVSCRAFLQNRVRALDLFQTVWGVLESPRSTFHAITIAEHKNYAFTLFGLLGIPALAFMMSHFRMGDVFENLMTSIGVSVVGGVVCGAATAPLAAFVHSLASRVIKTDASFRVSLGVTAYAMAPAALIGVLTLIIQWMTFGQHYFDGNPPPMTINPSSAWAMAVLTGAGALWSTGLAVVGTSVGGRAGVLKSAVIVLLTLGVVGGMWWWGASVAAAAMQ